MKSGLFVLLVFTNVCAQLASQANASPSHAPSQTLKSLIWKPNGSAYDLKVEANNILFCDAAGSHSLSMINGLFSGSVRPCHKQEPRSACPESPLDVEVRTPDFGPMDVIDVGEHSYPLKGRVNDCDIDGSSLIASTGSYVVLIDTSKDSLRVISPHGGDRVAIGRSWLAWTDASRLHVVPRVK